MSGTIQCEYCGKFISYQDLENDKAKAEYTPDSYFTVEGVYFICMKCYEGRGEGE